MKQNIRRLGKKGVKTKTKMLESRKRIIRRMNVGERKRDRQVKIHTRREYINK
jgi:hypothetical protein